MMNDKARPWRAMMSDKARLWRAVMSVAFGEGEGKAKKISLDIAHALVYNVINFVFGAML